MHRSEKLEDLKTLICKRERLLISFSGGVDSYSGEYDCTTEYLGRVDMSKIEAV